MLCVLFLEFWVIMHFSILVIRCISNQICLLHIGLLSRGFDKYWAYKCVLDVFAIIFQITALFVWPWFTQQKSSDRLWLLPIAAVLVSFGWWENFVEITSPFGITIFYFTKNVYATIVKSFYLKKQIL